MAARFGAKIVPFGTVGEDDFGQVSFGLLFTELFFLHKVILEEKRLVFNIK